MPTDSENVRLSGKTGSDPCAARTTRLTQMYGPAVRCKKISSNWRRRSCINVSGLRLERVLLRAIMDISARAFSLADRPRSGHLGHQCSHALGRPILHFVLSSRRPRQETVDRVTSSLAPHIAQFFVRAKGRSFVPARRTSIAPRAGAVKAGPIATHCFCERFELLEFKQLRAWGMGIVAKSLQARQHRSHQHEEIFFP